MNERTFMRPFLKILLVCVALSLLLNSLVSCKRKESQMEAPPPLAIHLVHGPEIRAYANFLQDRFFHENHRIERGRQLVVETISEQSVRAARRISNGDLKTEVWISPSSSLVNLVNSHLKNLGARQVNCKPIFSTPVVLAVREQDLKTLDANKHKISWKNLKASLKTNSADIKSVAIMHALPSTSVSGLAALIELSSLSALGLNPYEASNPDNLSKRLAAIESAVSSYAATESTLLNKLVNSQPGGVRAVFTTEQQVATFNADILGRYPQLVALYPDEGSYWEDYQLCTSDADWVTAAHRTGIQALANIAISPDAQVEAKKRGFRPADSKTPDFAPLLNSFGINLELPDKNFKSVDGPSVQYLLENWSKFSRPMAITVVLDTSGSMEGPALNGSKDATREIFASLDPRAKVSLISFSAQPVIQSDFTSDAPSLIPRLDLLQAQGGSALYDALKRAIELNTRPELSQYRKIVVILTDGDDKNSEISKESLLSYVVQNVPKFEIDLSIIAIEHESVNFSDLEQFTRAGGGTFRRISTMEIEAVVHEVGEKF